MGMGILNIRTAADDMLCIEQGRINSEMSSLILHGLTPSRHLIINARRV